MVCVSRWVNEALAVMRSAFVLGAVVAWLGMTGNIWGKLGMAAQGYLLC